MSAKKGSKKTTFVTDNSSLNPEQQPNEQQPTDVSGDDFGIDDEAATTTVDDTTVPASSVHPGALGGMSQTIESSAVHDDDDDDEEEEDGTSYENPFAQRYSISSVSNTLVDNKRFSKGSLGLKGDTAGESSA
jgi:hypothetical protein